MRITHRKHGDARPLRLSLGRDITTLTVTVRVARGVGEPSVIDKEAVIDDPATGEIHVELTEGESDALVPGDWLAEARPSDGTIHPDSDYLKLSVHAALSPATSP